MTGIALGASFLGGAAFGWPLALLVAVAFAGLVLTAMQRRRLLGPGALVVAVAAAGAWRAVPPPNVQPPAWADAAAGVRGRIDHAPTASGRSQQFVVAVEAVEVGGRWIDAGGLVCVSAPAFPSLALDDRIRLRGAVHPLQDLPAAARMAVRSRGCGATVFATTAALEVTGAGWRRMAAAVRRSLSRNLQHAAPGDAGALLSGLVTGEDHALTERHQEAFLRTGTTHVTAVSGSNLALVLAIATGLGRAAGWRRRLAWQGLTVAVVWCYAFLVGLEPPALRAALVASGAVFAIRVGRRADYVTLILVATAVMVAVEPAQLWRLSFQLSLASSVALAVVLSGINPAGLFGWLEVALLAAVAAQLATLPVLLPTFDTLSLVSVPANLLIGPLVGVAFPLAALAGMAAFVWFPLGEALVLPARLAADGVLAVVDTLSSVGGGALTPGAFRSPARWLVAAVAAAAVTALSRDGRAWAARLPGAVREARPEARLAAAALLAGATLGIAVRILA